MTDAQIPNRGHLILVPGFAGFDALGQLDYYAGVLERFQAWNGWDDPNKRRRPLTLSFFDSFPTGGVALRAQRLLVYLASRVARGEIAEADTVALIGHSTGALDIRSVIKTLIASPHGQIEVPGALPVRHGDILSKLRHVVFLSAPHFGTNLADAFCSLEDMIQNAVKDASLLVQLNREPVATLRRLLDRMVRFTKSDLVLSLSDALNESDEGRSSDKLKRADAREARSQLSLWLEHMSKDFDAIRDLRSYGPHTQGSLSPAHTSAAERKVELDGFVAYDITTLSYVTRAPQAPPGQELTGVRRRIAKVVPGLNWAASALTTVGELLWWLPQVSVPAVGVSTVLALTLPVAIQLLHRFPRSAFDLFYNFNAAEQGPFSHVVQRCSAQLAPAAVDLFVDHTVNIARASIAGADNDGVVNTLSMLWPHDPDHPERHRHFLVPADHADIIGHYARRPERLPRTLLHGDARSQYYSYDIFPSGSEFDEVKFTIVWEHLFESCAQALL